MKLKLNFKGTDFALLGALLLFSLIMAGCDDNGYTISGGGGGGTPPPAESEADKCAPGFYSFGTDSDGKTHFTYILQKNGVVKYNLQDGPVGEYTVTGDRVAMNNVFPNNPSRLLELYVTEAAEDCTYTVLRGTVNGAAVTSRRL